MNHIPETFKHHFDYAYCMCLS